MSGEGRANLIKDSLHRLHAFGVCVLSLTCDGPSCNFLMIRALGAKFHIGEMRPSFPHPANPTQEDVFLDVCHMLKLL